MKRIEPGFIEGMLQYLLYLVPFGLVWLPIAALVAGVGGTQLAATLLAGVLAWILINPILFRLSYFECKECRHVCEHSEVVCRGFGLVL